MDRLKIKPEAQVAHLRRVIADAITNLTLLSPAVTDDRWANMLGGVLYNLRQALHETTPER